MLLIIRIFFARSTKRFNWQSHSSRIIIRLIRIVRIVAVGVSQTDINLISADVSKLVATSSCDMVAAVAFLNPGLALRSLHVLVVVDVLKELLILLVEFI